MSERERQRDSRSEGGGLEIVSLFVLVFRELIVDFLAILIPGFWFIMASLPALFLPLGWLVRLQDSGKTPHLLETLEDVSKTMSGFHTEIFYSTIVLSWLIGHLMFRQDQMRPDQRSWILANFANSNLKPLSLKIRWILLTFGIKVRFPIRAAPGPDRKRDFDGMVQPLDNQNDLGVVSVIFPYSHLKDYLIRRGFEDIAQDVSWDPTASDHKAIVQQSKNFLNAKKAKLEFYHPEKLRDLTRIESHIRLHSSLWYACFYLRCMSLIGVLCGILSNGLLYARGDRGESAILIFPLLVFITTLFFQYLIERAFHYQRTREVFFVLTYARLADNPT